VAVPFGGVSFEVGNTIVVSMPGYVDEAEITVGFVVVVMVGLVMGKGGARFTLLAVLRGLVGALGGRTAAPVEGR
jgi:hypothetical protein